MKKLIFITLLFFFHSLLFGQNTTEKYSISGYVKDGESGENLIGVTIYVNELETGTTTNVYGFYSITIPAGEYTLNYSYVGFDDFEKKIILNQDLTETIELGVGAEELVEIVVSADSNKEEINSTQMSVDRITTKQAKVLPSLFGEVDIIKTLQLKPGVSTSGEGSAGIVVRGGGPDQNLIILDEAIVYNPNHLFGFFSTFNSDAVKDVQLYKGGFPAEYGGRLSSVIDVRLKEGNRKKFAGSGGIGLISSRLTLEGPIVKDRGSFMVSGRRTYADLITRAVNKSRADDPDFDKIPDYFFYDLNTKLNFDINDKNRIFASGYFGRDKFGFNDDDFNFDFDWGNTTTTARWNHIYNPKLFSNATFTFSDYVFKIRSKFDEFSFEVGSGIRDYNTKIDYYWAPNNKHNIKFGVNFAHHNFDVGRFQATVASEEDPLFESDVSFQAVDMNAYIAEEFEVNDKLKLNGGIRFSSFLNDGQFYAGIEPRAAMKYSLKDNISLKASYTRMYQYIHLVASSGASLPTDVWYPSNKTVKPQLSDQVAAGVSIGIGEQFLLTNEVYYKWQKRQIDFRDGADLFINPNLDEEFVFGKGTSYGNEIYLEKKKGKITGWVGYTLSWSWRKFPDISGGQRFHPRYDRRHDISVVLMYEINRKFTITGSWVYNTGNAYSLPSSRAILFETQGIDPQVITIYPARNSERQPAYHRLDVGLVYKFFPRFGEADLTLSAYNAYDRRNPYFIYFDIENNEETGLPESIKAKQVSLFPILPSLTFNFKF